jgi:hypothetical protein
MAKRSYNYNGYYFEVTVQEVIVVFEYLKEYEGAFRVQGNGAIA